MDVRLVFQGGGARLVTLIAAAEAMRDLEHERGITISHVAGVSAGSLAAAIFASHRSIPEQVEVLKRIGPQALATFGRRPSTWRMALRILRGKPLFNERALDTLTQELFYKYEKNPMSKLSDLRVPTTVVAADVRAKQRIDYDSKASHDLRRVLSDSCAIPIAFRTHKNSDLVVDGGIASNLPVDVVLGGDSGDSCIIAFKFDDTGEEPSKVDSVFTYGTALLSTAIDSGVDIAADRIVSAGGHVCLLPDHFRTFDFASALETGLSGPIYEFAKSQAKTGIAKILDKYEAHQEISSKARPRGTIHEEIYSSHRDIMEAFPVREIRCSTIVVGNCLRTAQDPGTAITDDIYQIVDYEATNEEMMALRIGMPSGRVLVEDHKPCDLRLNGRNFLASTQIAVSLDDPEGIYGLLRYNLVFLKNPLSKSAGFVRACFHTRQRDALKKLSDPNDFEWIRTRNRQDLVSPIEDYIIALPQALKPPILVDLRDQQIEVPVNKRIDGFDPMREAWTKGRELQLSEIEDSLSDYGLIHIGMGMQLQGWRTENLAPNHFSGVAILPQA